MPPNYHSHYHYHYHYHCYIHPTMLHTALITQPVHLHHPGAHDLARTPARILHSLAQVPVGCFHGSAVSAEGLVQSPLARSLSRTARSLALSLDTLPAPLLPMSFDFSLPIARQQGMLTQGAASRRTGLRERMAHVRRALAAVVAGGAAAVARGQRGPGGSERNPARTGSNMSHADMCAPAILGDDSETGGARG